MAKAASRCASSAADVVTNLFRGNRRWGQIKVEDQSFEVVGVLEKQGNMLGWSLDNRVIIPIRELIADIWNRPRLTKLM